MALSDYLIVPGLVTEEIDQEILVCDTDLALVHRVSGPAADVLRRVLANDGVPAALEDDGITAGLVAAGVLVAADAPAELVSRRSFVGAAAAVGAFGIVTLALPRAAAASSDVEPSGGSGGSESLDPFVDPDLTQIIYPDLTAPAVERRRTIQVFWAEEDPEINGGAFTFQVTITGSIPSFSPITLTGLASDTLRSIFIEDWAVDETITVSFVTTSLNTPVSGESRTTKRTQ